MQSLAKRSTHGVKVIAFSTPDDKRRGFHELLSSRSHFSGVAKDRYVLTQEQRQMLKNKGIRFKEIDD